MAGDITGRSIINFDAVAEVLKQEIQEALEEVIEEVSAPLIDAMMVEVNKSIRKKLGAVACSLLADYDMRCLGNIIEIRIRNAYEPRSPS